MTEHQPENNADVASPTPWTRRDIAEVVILVAAVLWALFRIGRSFQILFGESNDLFTYYSLWYVLWHRELADIALRQSLYLPHTWLFVTPFFVCGWPAARLLMLLANGAAIFTIGWQLGALTGLSTRRRWLFLALFTGWLGAGLVVALGNLALVCVAFVVVAHPFEGPRRQLALAFSAMKQSLVFPLYFDLLLRKPKALLVPFAVFGVCGLAALAWARLTPFEALAMARGGMKAVGSWTQYDHTGLRRIFAFISTNSAVLSLLNWAVWFVLFGIVFKRLREPAPRLGAMMLLSLLPMYHNVYDMVAAAPAVAVLLGRGRLLWAVLASIALSANLGTGARSLAPAPLKAVAGYFEFAYYPWLILVLLGALLLACRPQAEPRA